MAKRGGFPGGMMPGNMKTLEDLIISAVNEALRAQEEDYNNNMSKISGGMGLGGLPF